MKKKNNNSILTVNVSALKHNYNVLKNYVNPSDAGVVLKSNAYGVGAKEIGKILYQEGARTFFTAHSFEGVELRKALPHEAEIYILHGCYDYDGEDFNEYNLIPILNNEEQLKIAKEHNIKKYGIHVNTGMNRLSFSSIPDNVSPCLIISHFSGEQNDEQFSKFNEITKNFKDVKKSICASNAISTPKEYHMDIIRFGYALYGEMDNNLGLKNTISLKAKIIGLYEVKKGDKVGYDSTFIFEKDGKIATIAVGYADGYSRTLSNKGYGYINGTKINLVGRVSMDLTVFDVSDIENIKIGDEIELIGDNIKVKELASLLNTTGYEILTSLSKRYKRVYK